MDIQWLDGQNADNHFILEMHFNNGSKSYLKNESYDQIVHYYTMFWDCPDIAALTIYDKSEKVVANKCRAMAA